MKKGDVELPPVKKKEPRFQRIDVPLVNEEIAVYAGVRVREALRELSLDMTLYKGVKFNQILEAVYNQGKKDGARETFEMLDRQMESAKREIPHRNPGAPKKPTKRARRRR